MNITSPFFAALLANGPVKAGGYTYFLYGGKIRKCKSKRGPRKSKTEREKQITDHFTEVRKIWKVYRLAIGVLPIWRVPFHQRRMSASKTRSMGVQNLPFFRGIAGSSRDHERGTPRLDNHLAVGKRDRGPESESLGSSVRGILLRHAT